MSNIKLFQSKQVRTYWDKKEKKWYFAIVDVIEILTESFYGGIISLPHQVAFGFSLRVYDGQPMYRIYIWKLKIWISIRMTKEEVERGKINSRVDW